jgi:hypothetical protein
MILIYTQHITPRFEFIVKQIFKRILRLNYLITTDITEYINSPHPLICYSKEYPGKGIQIVPHGLLTETGIHPLDIDISYWNELPVFFRTTGKNIPFDLFAASFFLITRYEEYLEKETDKHGRYPAEKSIAFKYNFLEQPIVDQWALELKKEIEKDSQTLQYSPTHFKFIPTIDVDNVFAFRHKGPFINGLHLIKDLAKGNWAQAKYRFDVISRQKNDPFFNLEELSMLHHQYGAFPLFFFHCGIYGKYDKKTLIPSLGYRYVKKCISRDFIVGLHPSYKASFSSWRFKMEKKTMESGILDRKIYHNRFHYLRFRIPESYNMLSREKITNDWSMGYSSYPGFRAGTSFPFRFFDLERNKTHRLMIHPFSIMDKTLKSDLSLTPDEAYTYTLTMMKKVKEVEGTFVTIFHNENVADVFGWKGWYQMYKSLLKEISNNQLL